MKISNSDIIEMVTRCVSNLTESKSLLPEETSKLMALNKVLELMKSIPEEYIMDKRILKRGNVRYMWWACGEEDEDGVLTEYENIPNREDVKSFLTKNGFAADEQVGMEEVRDFYEYFFKSISVEFGGGIYEYSELTPPPPVLKDRTNIKRVKWADIWLNIHTENLFKK